MGKVVSTVLLCLLLAAGASADEVIVSSDNLNFSQPLTVLSNPSTTIQIGYNFNLYHKWLCMDIRGRTAQQSSSKTVPVNTPDGIAYDRLTVLPSIDTGIMIKLLNSYHVEPYVFSLFNLTMVNSSLMYEDYQTSSNIYALGLRTGFGGNILFGSRLPSFLLNTDMGYQYLPMATDNTGILTMDGIFVSMGFGISF
ncbi:MAG: hypothetical protein M1491_04725 [Deltaproteobacteria bacterium]|nr:hypothetical protein [Deltaproteobacteria bacterium]MCL5277302.1 hypothetical protein [Deltaproteobacteria bacterium]